MQILDEDLDEFIAIFSNEYGVVLSRAEASEIAGNFASLYELLCEPLPYEKDKATRPALEGPPASPSQQ